MNELEQLRADRDSYLWSAQRSRDIAANPKAYFQGLNSGRRPRTAELEQIRQEHLQKAESMDQQASQLGPRIAQLEADEAFDRAREQELLQLVSAMWRDIVRIFIPLSYLIKRREGWQWRRDIYFCLFLLLIILYVASIFFGAFFGAVFTNCCLTALFLEIYHLIPWCIKYKKSLGLILSCVLLLGTIYAFLASLGLLLNL